MSGRYGGANAPPGFEWQAGKTAASIRFVNEAFELLQTHAPSARKAEALFKYCDDIKSGKVVLESWLSVNDFLNQVVE